MAYFPHAFQKMLVATNGTPLLAGNGSRTSADLAAGQLGILSPKTNLLVDPTATVNAAFYQANPMVILAQGSFHTTDKLGGSFHGGYKESVKTKGINPKYVSAFYRVDKAEPIQNLVRVGVLNCTSIACDTTYRLRLDVKGSPALRYLTHNAYLTVDAYTGCCDASNNNIDPVSVLLSWKDQINASPLISPFVQAKVFNLAASTGTTSANALATTTTTATFALDSFTGVVVGQKVTGTNIPAGSVVTTVNGTTSITITFPELASAPAASGFNNQNDLKFYGEVATGTYVAETGATAPDSNDAFLDLLGAYVDTQFGNASFQPTDHFELQPVQIYTSIVDQTGDPCQTTCFSVAELVTPFQGRGFGETLIRELILSKRYEQEPFNADPRMREILDSTTLTYTKADGTVVSGEISRGSKYSVYHILHSVPRSSNPSGTMDNDQYLVKVVVAGSVSNFETFMNSYLTIAGNPVQLQVLK